MWRIEMVAAGRLFEGEEAVVQVTGWVGAHAHVAVSWTTRVSATASSSAVGHQARTQRLDVERVLSPLGGKEEGRSEPDDPDDRDNDQ